MNRTVQIGGALVFVAFVFSVAYGIEGPWIGRSLIALVVAGSGFVLSLPLAVSLGMFVIPADLMLISRSPHSLDILVWAGFVAMPLLIGRFVSGAGGRFAADTTSGETEPPTTSVETGTETLEFHPDVLESEDPSEQLQDILVSRMEAARSRFGFDNLVYFHVRDSEARPGYVINDYGEIKTDFKIGTDRARGVGWVLRHGEKLVLEEKQIDWRNLQYHRKPVDPDRVMVLPVSVKQDLIGITVLEWDAWDEDEPPGELDRFLDELEVMMRIDRSVREMERREKEVDLMRKVTEIKPLEHERIETIYQRMTDLIRDLIPADNVEFVTVDGSRTDDTVVKQRRLFYDRCCELLESGKSTLRINRMEDFSFKGKRIRRFAPPDVQAFLGGVLEDDGDVLGYFCLDDEQEAFFTSDDEKLLKLLIERMSGLIRLAQQHESVTHERDTFLEWLGGIRSISQTTDPERTMRKIVDVLEQTFQPMGVAIYWETDGKFTLQHSSDSINPGRRLASDSTFVRRLGDNPDRGLVEFPKIQRLNSYDAPAGANLLMAYPMRDGEEIVGFMGLFYRDEPSDRARQFFEYGIPLLARNLEYAHQYASIKIKHRRDSVTNFPKYDPWKRSLNEAVSTNSDRDVVVWRFVVPDFEQVVENRGLKRAEQWAKSIGTRITEDFSRETVSRFHGTDFGGYSFCSSREIQATITELCEDVSDWSFPAGRWPTAPLSGYEVFRSPFPDVETMIEAARRDLLNQEESQNPRKETTVDSV